MTRPCIVIVAGETSGDNLAAALIQALRARCPELTFAGIAGPAMARAGCTAWTPSEALAVMGLFEVVRHLPQLLALSTATAARALAARPLLFVGVDAPEFNLRLAARLHRAGVPTVQYVSPQVWAWRQGRVRRMAGTLDLVLCLLPFEKRFYDAAGLPAEFVGHPLADRLPLEPDRAGARATLGLSADATVVALLPGSRRGEVLRLADDFIGAAGWLARRRPGTMLVAPMANRPRGCCSRRGRLRAARGGARDQARPDRAAADRAGRLRHRDAETLLCKRPMVVAYRLGAATAGLMRVLCLMKAPFFAQPNLLAGRELVPELFQEAVTPERLGAELLRWLEDPPRAAAAIAEFHRIHLELRRGASARAADAVLGLLERRAGGGHP
jgi:lipid-A-disaccharide synthase